MTLFYYSIKLSWAKGMILYLARHYLVNVLVFVSGLAILPIYAGMEPGRVIHQAIFWGGLLGMIYTFYRLKSNNIWPLYDNLRHPKYLLLLEFFLLTQLLNIGLIPLL